MSTTATAAREKTPEEKPPAQNPPTEKMPGHWLLARMGKRVLRPGGLELTRQLLDQLAIESSDQVVEFAPGLGITAQMTLARRPEAYTAVERDANAASTVKTYLAGSNQRCVLGTAEETGLPTASASVVYGEAMLSMHPPTAKARIVAEAARLLTRGGRYGIHELCLIPGDLDQSLRDAIQRELSSEIHVGVRPLTLSEWRELLEAAGLTVISEHTAPMHLLEPKRLLRDEGLLRSMRFAWNVATHPAARRRIVAMRKVFRKYQRHLAAVAMVAQSVKTNGDNTPCNCSES